MKRSATDILRHAFDLTIANWPVIAIRIVESIILLIITVSAAFAAIVPIVVAAGLSNLSDPTSAAAAIIDHWLLIVYALVVVGVLLIVLVAIHAFVDGGIARVLIDSERVNAQPSFSMDRLIAGGRSAWWAIFWIYNIVWSIAGIILFVPAGATLAAMLLVTDNTGRIVIGCVGLAFLFIILLPIAVIAALWTQKAIAICVARNEGAAESMRIARHEIRYDFSRHFVVAFIVLVVSIGGAAVISMLSMPMSFMDHNEPLLFAFMAPAQLVVSFAQTIFSAATGVWLLGSFIALTEER